MCFTYKRNVSFSKLNQGAVKLVWLLTLARPRVIPLVSSSKDQTNVSKRLVIISQKLQKLQKCARFLAE